MTKVISTVDHIQEKLDKKKRMYAMNFMHEDNDPKVPEECEQWRNPEYGEVSEALTKAYPSEKTGKNG